MSEIKSIQAQNLDLSRPCFVVIDGVTAEVVVAGPVKIGPGKTDIAVSLGVVMPGGDLGTVVVAPRVRLDVLVGAGVQA